MSANVRIWISPKTIKAAEKLAQKTAPAWPMNRASSVNVVLIEALTTAIEKLEKRTTAPAKLLQVSLRVPDELQERLKKVADAAGVSIKKYCGEILADELAK